MYDNKSTENDSSVSTNIFYSTANKDIFCTDELQDTNIF